MDHGKTFLIKALTGFDTDRLKEEKKRGITIENGFVSVNGVQLREDYVTTGLTSRHDGTYIVEQGCVFVMGDNRLVSRDSTDGMLGSIPVARVIGLVERVLIPFSRAKRMQWVQYGV